MNTPPNPKTVVIIGALDTKGAEFAFVKRLIEAEGLDTLVVDFGTMGAPEFEPDVSREEVAAAAGGDISYFASGEHKDEAMQTMARGLAVVVRRLYDEGKLGGIIGMGGTGGTSIATTGMRVLPVGVPKVMVSTVAGGDVSAYAGTRDIVFIPSIVDVAGINSISRAIFANAAGAIAGMVKLDRPPAGEERPLVTASMFGNTTECVERARGLVENGGYEVLVFHATGIGGRTMESLIADGYIVGSLDTTTTEIADEVCGGVFSAGPDRCAASVPGRRPGGHRAGVRRHGQLRLDRDCSRTVRRPEPVPVEPERHAAPHQRRGERSHRRDHRRCSQPGNRARRRAIAPEGRFDAGQRGGAFLGPGGRPGVLRRHPTWPEGGHLHQ